MIGIYTFQVEIYQSDIFVYIWLSLALHGLETLGLKNELILE